MFPSLRQLHIVHLTWLMIMTFTIEYGHICTYMYHIMHVSVEHNLITIQPWGFRRDWTGVYSKPLDGCRAFHLGNWSPQSSGSWGRRPRMNSPTTSHGSGRFHQKNDGHDVDEMGYPLRNKLTRYIGTIHDFGNYWAPCSDPFPSGNLL